MSIKLVSRLCKLGIFIMVILSNSYRLPHQSIINFHNKLYILPIKILIIANYLTKKMRKKMKIHYQTLNQYKIQINC